MNPKYKIIAIGEDDAAFEFRDDYLGLIGRWEPDLPGCLDGSGEFHFVRDGRLSSAYFYSVEVAPVNDQGEVIHEQG